MEKYYSNEFHYFSQNYALTPKLKKRESRRARMKREKDLIALDERRNKLWDERSKSVEYFEIKPFRNGFIRYFGLREDLIGRDDYKYLKETLDACNIEQFSKNRKFIFSKKYSTGRFSRFFNREMKFKNLSDKEYEKLSLKAKNYFVREEKVSWSGVIYNIWHCDIPFWMLTTRIKPHYIRYLKRYNVDVESQIDELRNKIKKNHLDCKINHARGYKNSWRDEWSLSFDRKRMINKITKKEMEEDAKDFFNT